LIWIRSAYSFCDLFKVGFRRARLAKINVAVVQAGSSVFDTPSTLRRALSYCEEAADSQARLVVFPEAFLGGYAKGTDFGARVGSRSSRGRDDFHRYWQSAIDIPGKEVETLRAMAKRFHIDLVIGVIERDGGTLYCSVVFVGPDGELRGKHRKLMPTGSERLVWGLGDGSTMPAIATDFGILGAAICWENYMPLFRMAMYAKGVNIWCAPTVDDRDGWQSSMRHIALEGRCFVLSACQYLRRSQCPEAYDAIQGNSPETVLIEGGSLIVSPLGDVLAGPLRGREGLLTAEIETEEVIRGKFDLDVAGHYARPDIFRMTVDETSRAAVSRFGGVGTDRQEGSPASNENGELDSPVKYEPTAPPSSS
jgi:nitrilase